MLAGVLPDCLAIASFRDALCHQSSCFPFIGSQLAAGQSPHHDVEVETIEDWPTDPPEILPAVSRRARARAGSIKVPATPTWIGSAHQLKSRRKPNHRSCSMDLNLPRLHGLPKRLENTLRKLWQFIEEENAAVRARHCAWAWDGPSPN